MDNAFAPSDVFLQSATPLVATFDKAEMEFAAAIIVAACQDLGAWQAVFPHEMKAALERRSEIPWTTCPFVRPDFYGLVEKGWARWIDERPEPLRIAFTEAGLERLGASRWIVRSSSEACKAVADAQLDREVLSTVALAEGTDAAKNGGSDG